MNKKIIIIDNDEDTREIIAYILSEQGYDVIASADSTPLMDLKAQNPALVILDHWLDGELGDELCLKIKSFAATAHIPVMLISATTGLEGTSTRCKADAFLEKPFDIDELSLKVAQVIKAE